MKGAHMKYTAGFGRIDIRINEGMLLSDFLDRYDISSKNRCLYLRDGMILVDRKPADSVDAGLKAGQTLTIRIKEEEPGFVPSETECPVVYEDDFVYIAHKDPGIIIHGEGDTLASRAAAYQLSHGISVPVRYIHRLDKETTGLVLFVKVPFFQPWYDRMLKEKKIHRHYLAICTGKAKPGRRFTFSSPIGRDRHVSGRYRQSPSGKEACTKAECLAVNGEYILMGCTLETGRTHQVRVHLSSAGFPIVNDPLYGDPSPDFENMGLWADEITFSNPLTDEAVTVRDFPAEDYAFFRY